MVARIGDQCCDSLSEAISKAEDGDTVVVSVGTYSEPIVLEGRSIMLEGTGTHLISGDLMLKDSKDVRCVLVV